MLEIIITTIFLSTILNIFLKNFQIPTIVWYIITWIFISYVFWLHELVANHDLKLIAEFGIVFLMFTIWLEFPINQLVKIKKNVFLIWGLQFLITSLLFFIFANYVFWFNLKTAFILWVWFTLSSTAIVLKILKENHNINKEYWQKALWILLFQDLVVIPILLIISILSVNDSNIYILFWKVIFWVISLFTFLWFIWKYLLNPFFYYVTKANSNEIFVSAILLIIMWSSYIANYLGLSYSLWALIAWVMIAETHYRYQVEADLIPFRNLLLGVFFVTVGMQLDFLVIINNLWIIIPFLVFLILIKVIIIFWIVSFVAKKKIALETSLSLFQFGEFGIVIFELASKNRLIDEKLWQILIVIIILSMIVTPFVIKHLRRIVLFLTKDSSIDIEDISNELSNHIIIVGYGRIWKIVAKLLKNANYDYLIVENDPKILRDAKKKWEPILYWNASKTHILNSLNVKEASYIIISLWDSNDVFLICNIISRLSLDSKIIVKVNRFEQKEKLKNLNLSTIIVETEETALSIFNKIVE